MRRTLLNLIALSGLTLGLSFSGLMLAADAPPPCGPAGDLSSDLSRNVDANSRCFEIRMYTAEPIKDGVGGIDNLHQRFREKEVSIFEKHGAEVIAVWQRLDDPNTLVWMLAYRDRAHRTEVWAAFAADPEWVELRQKYEVPISANTFMMSATDYSNLK
ncbi:MAG: NIPSNAP family protein [Pseudohongiellaceae bacterium]